MVKMFVKYIKQSELLKNSSILVSGTVIAQSIPILLQPFLRRYFAPEDFGIYSVYTSLIGILMVISCFRYEQTIVLPRSDRNASVLATTSILFCISFSLFLLLLVVLFKDWIGGIINLPKSKQFILYFVPIGTFLLGIFQVFNFWLIRQKAFLPISVNKLSRRIVEGGSQSSFAFIGFPKGLIYGDIFGQIANVLVSFFQSIKKGYTLKDFDVYRAKSLLRKYADFPRYSLVPSLLSTASFLMPVLLINRFYSSEQAGYFDLTKLILSVPLALISGSLSSVVLHKVSLSYREKKKFLKDLKPLFGLVGFIFIGEVIFIVFLSKTIFVFLFGEQWITSGIIAKMLVWPFALNFITSSFTSIFVALNKVVWQSIWQILYFLLILSLVLFSFLPFIDFIKVYVFFEVFANLSMILLLFFLLRSYEGKLVNE